MYVQRTQMVIMAVPGMVAALTIVALRTYGSARLAPSLRYGDELAADVARELPAELGHGLEHGFELTAEGCQLVLGHWRDGGKDGAGPTGVARVAVDEP